MAVAPSPPVGPGARHVFRTLPIDMNRSPRIARSLQALALALLLPLGAGCQGWTMDYGKPAAQFEAKDAVALAQEYLGEKVSVRGGLSVDVSNPEDCVVELQGRHGR